MPNSLTVAEFEVLTGKGFVPGVKILKMYLYDPERCSLVVDDEGSLTISQSLLGDLFYRRGFWRKVSLQDRSSAEQAGGVADGS